MKKRILIAAAAALCLAAVIGAGWWFTPRTIAKNEKYTITVERAKWILRPGPELEAYHPPSSLTGEYAPSFQSVEDLHRGILTGNFPRSRLCPLYTALGGAGKAEILPLPLLREPVLPDGAKVEKIEWTGQRCTYLVSGIARGTASFSLYMDQTGVRDSWTDGNLYGLLRADAEGTEPERGAAVTHRTWATVLTYELQTANGTCLVMEQFSPDTADFSQAVPTVVELFWEEDGLYHSWYIEGLAQRPSVEFLKELAEMKWK